MNIGGISSNYKAYGESIQEHRQNIRRGTEECQTCKSRKYVDGSDESDVSFKSPGHISPESSVGQVSAHEHMHVSNAMAEGAKENKEVVSVSVSVKMETCPECGRSYAAGGQTNSVIKTTQEKYGNGPYEQNRKAFDAASAIGGNVDLSA